MKKKYTKKQIAEAIKYWKTILENMENNVNIDLNDFKMNVKKYQSVDEMIYKQYKQYNNIFPYIDPDKIINTVSNIFNEYGITSRFFETGDKEDINMYTMPIMGVEWQKPEFEDGYVFHGGQYDFSDYKVDKSQLNNKLHQYGLELCFEHDEIIGDNYEDVNKFRHKFDQPNPPTKCYVKTKLNIIDANKFYNAFKK